MADVLGQIRQKYPEYAPYDDTTLAAAVVDKYPEYKPYLDSYLHPASADLAAQGAQTASQAPSQFAAEVSQPEARQAQLAGQQKRQANENLVNQQIEGIQNPELRGATKLAQGMMESPTNAALMAALPASPIASRIAAGAFGALSGIDVVKEYPRLMQLYQSGDMDKFREELTQHGLGAILGGLGLLHAVRGAPLTEAQRDIYADNAAKATEKAAPLAEKAGPDTAAAAQEAAEAQSDLADKALVPGEPEEQEGPPIVKGAKVVQTRTGPVEPNPPAMDEVRDELKQTLQDRGVDPDDPQAQANLYQQQYGISKPITVKSVGDVPVSESSVTPQDYQIDLADNDPSKVAHELQHIRQNEGQIASVPEGEGANDQISSQTSADLGSQRWAPRPIPNLNRLAIDGQAKAAISEVAEDLIRPGPTTFASVQAAAKELNMSVEDLQKLGPDTVHLAVQSTAGRGLVGSAAEGYDQIKQASLANPTPENRAATATARIALLRTMDASNAVSHNLALGLAAHNIKVPALEAALPHGIADLVSELQKNNAFSDEMGDMLDATDMTDPLARQRLSTILQTKVDEAIPKTFSMRAKIGFYYLNNILSALTTPAIKFSSDLTTTFTAPLVQTVGALTKGDTLKSALAQGDARLYGQVAALQDGLMAFGHAVRYGPQEYGRANPLGNSLPAKIIGAPVRLIGAVNDMFHLWNVRGELYAEGAKQHIESGGTFEDLYKNAKAYADNPTPEALEAAETEARKNTLTMQPGNFTKGILSVRGMLPGGEELMPVVTVPVNLVKIAAEASPLGSFNVSSAMAEGRPVSTQTAGRATLGSALFIYGIIQSLAGRLNGSGPTDSNENRNMRAAGVPPDSMLMSDGTWSPVKQFGPFGLSLATAANIGEIMKEAPNAPNLDKAIQAAWVHMGRTALNYPMLRGISDMVDLISGKNPRAADILAGNTVSGMVPFSSLWARTAAAIDPQQRKIDGFVDAIKARVPYFRKTLDPKLDWAGNPLKAPGSTFSRFVMPVSDFAPADSPSQQLAAASSVGPNPTTISLKKNFPTLKLEDADVHRLEQLSTSMNGQYFDRLDRAPSNLATMSPDDMKKIIDGNRGASKRLLIAEMAQDGRLKQYMAAAQMAAANKAQTNPYLLNLAAPGADKAADMMRRFGVPDSGLPDNISPDLAPQYNRELQIARSMMFQPYAHGNASEIGNMPFQQGRALVQQLDDKARALAAQQTLNRANRKSAAAAAQ